MTLSDKDPFIAEVKALLTGWTVTDVQPSQAHEGPVFRLILAKEGTNQRREVDIACSLGPWIDQAVDLPNEPQGTDTQREVHPDFEAMMRQMEHHMFYGKVPPEMVKSETDDEGETVVFDKVSDFVKDDDLCNMFFAVEDVTKRQIGFRCTVTGKEWWCTIGTIIQSRHTDRLATPEGRNQFARHPPFWPEWKPKTLGGVKP